MLEVTNLKDHLKVEDPVVDTQIDQVEAGRVVDLQAEKEEDVTIRTI